MDASIELAIERAIQQMQENLGEELTIDDMARAALFSKFHFSRLFQRVTGISPGRFLSALRLERAKQLLVSTSLNVIDISHRVGYTSVGTFSSRFSSCVGISPTTYRRLGGYGPHPAPEPVRGTTERVSTSISGRIVADPADRIGPVFVGLFRDPLPQGRPVRCTVLTRPGPYLLKDVPRGTWHLLVYGIPAADDEPRGTELFEPRRPYVGMPGAIPITSTSTDIGPIDVRLRPKRLLDPPIVVALPNLRGGTNRTNGADCLEDGTWTHRRASYAGANRSTNRSAAC